MNGPGKHINGRPIDQRSTKQVLIDSGWHRELKILAAKQGKAIRDLIEECFPELFDTYKDS